MKKLDAWTFVGLLAFASWVWLRDLAWWPDAGDALPLIIALPLFVWLRRPWQTRTGEWRWARGPLAVALCLFPLGIAFDSGLLLAGAWTCVLASWVEGRFVTPSHVASGQLLVLPMLAFPWMITDLDRVAWWFRLSGAAVTEKFMALGNLPVVREGTYLWVNDFAVSVEPACSGVNGLQSMLVAGGALAYVKLRGSSIFWWNLPLLVGAAWLANLLRILTATSCGAFLAPDVAARWVGPVHSFAGWLALCVVFLLCYSVFAAEAAWIARRPTPTRGERTWRMPWAELVLLGYGAWCSSGLISTWRWTPFDKLGWLAFLIWLLPLVWRGDSEWRSRQIFRKPLLVLGVVFFLLGAAADVNAVNHLGLAAVLASFARRPGVLVWAAGAIAWMPAAGWAGSQLGLEPTQFALLRVFIATLAAAWGLGIYRSRRSTEQPVPSRAPVFTGKATHAR